MSAMNATAGPSTAPAASSESMRRGYNYEEDAEPAEDHGKVYRFTIPSTILAATPFATAIGFIIGMRRGGARARLRFLAENAHRQPTTVQGWYFYTKTRNYRVFFAACKSGGKYALGLGAAAAAFTTAEEYLGYLREKYMPTPSDAGRTPPNPRRTSWRKGPAHIEDGAIAGSLLTFAGGLAYRLPNQLLFRGLIVGFTLGGLFSAGLLMQDKLAAATQKEKMVETVVDEVLSENDVPHAPSPAAVHAEDAKLGLHPVETDKDREAALVGGAIADSAGSMGWIDWALAKSGARKTAAPVHAAGDTSKPPVETNEDREAALVGGAVADSASSMGWIDWALAKSGARKE